MSDEKMEGSKANEMSEPETRVGEQRVQLDFQNESACGYGDPFVAVYVNGVQHDKVWAYLDREQGADGGWYQVVKFRRSNGNNAES